MTRVRKGFIWLYMFTKRLFYQWSFIVLLCLIPLTIPAVNEVMKEDSGVLHVAIANNDDGEKSADIVASLLEKNSIIRFSYADSEDDAVEMVKSQKADTAWVFEDDFDEKLDEYAKGGLSAPLVRIFERETSVPLNLSKEILFGAVYKELSFSVYKNFVRTNIADETKLPDEKLKMYYDNQEEYGSIIELAKLDSEKPVVRETNYLMAPIRGILSLLILLCALAGAMYHLKDKNEGKFAWMPVKSRIIATIGSCFSAAFLSAVAVMAAILLSDFSTGFFNEFINMIVYVFAVTGFTVVICILVNSQSKLGALIPGITIVSMVLSPIFFNLKILKPLRLLIPSHYYLYAVKKPEYLIYALFYTVAVFVLAYILNTFSQNKSKN